MHRHVSALAVGSLQGCNKILACAAYASIVELLPYKSKHTLHMLRNEIPEDGKELSPKNV